MSTPGTDKKRRHGHRGWIVENVVADDSMRIYPSNFVSGDKLAKYPQQLLWPIIYDPEGAKAFIDAVMNENIHEIEKYIRKFPEYDLGCESYLDALRVTHKVTENIERRRLKTIQRGDVNIDVSAVVDKTKKEMSIVVEIFRGFKLLGRRTLTRTAID